MSPRRQGKGTLSGLLYDPWRKLVSLALAILLWLFLDRQITSSVTLECSLATLDLEKVMPERTQWSYLFARVPLRDYKEDAFLAPDGTELKYVSLTFEGPSHVIDSIQAGEQFSVRAQPGRGEAAFEFEASMIDGDPEILRVLKSMDPPRVTATFLRNASQELNLSSNNVEVLTPPTNGENYQKRLDLPAATFAPTTITLRATEEAFKTLDLSGKLLVADLSNPDLWKGDEIEAQLTLLDRYRGQITTGASTVTIPLRPTFEQVTINVRVLLDLGNTPFEESDFESPEPQRIVLEASRQLMAHMSRDPQEQQAWADDNLYIYAGLPKGATLTELPAIMGRLQFSSDEGFEQGKDYLVGPIPVTLTPK